MTRQQGRIGQNEKFIVRGILQGLHSIFSSVYPNPTSSLSQAAV